MYRMRVQLMNGYHLDEESEYETGLLDWANSIMRNGYRYKRENGTTTFWPAHQIRSIQVYTMEDYDALMGD